MLFKKASRKTPAQYEADLIEYWKKEQIAQRVVDQRRAEGKQPFVLHDGPPFLTGTPHYGSILASVAKDSFLRFNAMNGRLVERTFGYDCHGLPAELAVEAKLGIKNKKEVADLGLDKYIEECRTLMTSTGNAWEPTIKRIGRWVDFDSTYYTMSKEYIESVWWAFKELHNKGLIYQGERVLPYCPKDATPVSKAEVAMDDSYREITEPSVYVKFWCEELRAFFVAWTTTPWTLPGNVALAINPNKYFHFVEVNGETLIIGSDSVKQVLEGIPHKTTHSVEGWLLVGKDYTPLFPLPETHKKIKHICQIRYADFVGTDGSGIVHIAPAYGEDDFNLVHPKIPPLHVVDENGVFTTTEYAGQHIWDANKKLAKTLVEKNQAIRIDYVKHKYPFCHRCGTKLMYKAHASWFLNVQQLKKRLLDKNTELNWFPSHLKYGRFKDIVEQAPDWNISRDRFWATPMPVWVGTKPDHENKEVVIGSYAELEQLTGRKLDDYHRPYVDDLTWTDAEGFTFHRVSKVLDCWFDSASMPFAQSHFPFENKNQFNPTADFVFEYVGQVRAWFYYMMVMSIALFDTKPFNNVSVSGTLAGTDGKKMSKSAQNFTDPNLVMDQTSADTLRLYLLSSSVMDGDDAAIKDVDIKDAHRKLMAVWNSYDFFTMYAEVDKWEYTPDIDNQTPETTDILDLWILSKLSEVNQAVITAMKEYNTPSAVKPLAQFPDDLNNWYIRRSRRRFWKAGNDQDKQSAYHTLHFVLTNYAKMLAPFAPFLSDELFQKLTGKPSVHLEDYPNFKFEQPAPAMDLIRQLTEKGLSLRSQKKLKVRQPLAVAFITSTAELGAEYCAILAEELNVKAVKVEVGKETKIELDYEITEELRSEGLAREVIRIVQGERKRLGFAVDERLGLRAGVSPESTAHPVLEAAIQKHQKLINDETLTLPVDRTDYTSTHEVEGALVDVGVWKS